MRKGDSGADYSHARPPASWLKGRNLTFVCRYLLDDARNQGKALKAAEARMLSAAGITIVGNFEYATNPTLTRAQGRADALVSLAELTKMRAPRPIVYFSMDRDLFISEIPMVLDYLSGAASVLGKGRVGVYGEYDLIEAAGRAGYVWLWQCYAWSRGKWSSYATVRQIRNGAWPRQYDADLNTAMADDIGGWILGQDYTPEDEDMDAKSALTIQPGMPNLTEGALDPGDTLSLEQSILGAYEHVLGVEKIAKSAVATALAAKDEAVATRGDLARLASKVDTVAAAIASLPAGGAGPTAEDIARAIVTQLKA